MVELGLNNFRRFKNLEPLSLGGVTFLVGENNSGKSTFTKAAILLSNFLTKEDSSVGGIFDIKHTESKIFSFKDNNFRHVYIDTFYQALCNQSDNGVISFKAKLEHYWISVNIVEPDAFKEERKTIGNYTTIDEFSLNYPEIRDTNPKYYKTELSKEIALVSKITIDDTHRGLTFCIDYENQRITVTIQNTDIKKELDTYEALFNSGKFDIESVEELVNTIDALRNRCVKETLSSQFGFASDNNNLLNFFFSKYSQNSYIDLIRVSFEEFSSILEDTKFEYIYAHSVHQLASYSYSTSASNDYVDQTISKFYNQVLKHRRGLLKCDRSPKDIVLEWMYDLRIGDDFIINSDTSLKTDDESKRLSVSIIEGGEEYDLSAKGIGMIQLFILLLRLATIVTDNKKIKTVVIEEPEQNLHPALQSHLADLFYKVHKEFNCQVIVETHSEYIIRKSQVLVSDLDKTTNPNPFKVYYFPQGKLPYELQYMPNGSFKQKFGSGFYDEAVRLHLKIMNKN